MDNGKKSKVTQSRDLLVSSILADTELAADFLRNYLPPEMAATLDWDSLQQDASETAEPDLSRRLSVLRYAARSKGDGVEVDVFIILESQPDKYMSFRLIEYFLSVCEQRVPAFKEGMRFPYPLAVVLHHGKKPWKKIVPMRDLIGGPEELKRTLFYFPSHLIDLAVMPVNELRGHPMVCALLDSLQSASAGILPHRFQQIVARLRDISGKQDVLPWLEALFKYYYAVCPDESKNIHDNAAKILTGLYGEKKAGKMATTILEAIQREGIGKGKATGEVGF